MDSYLKIDGDMCIVEVGGNWDTFAVENAGEDAVSDRVIGTSLLSHISSDPVKMYTEALIKRAQFAKGPIARPYRCDSPDTRRDMEMVAEAQPDGTVMIRHRLVQEIPFDHRVDFVVEVDVKAYVKRCNICASLLLDGEWTDPARLTQSSTFNVIHGICERCRGG